MGGYDITTRQLWESKFKTDYPSALYFLKIAMYQYGPDLKVSEFFNRINLDQFVLWSAYRLLSGKFEVVPNKEEKGKLSRIVSNTLKTRNFKNSVQDTLTGPSVKVQTVNLMFMIQYLDYPLDEETLLDLTELPHFAFDNNNEQTKYLYLERKLPLDKLKRRLVQNVEMETTMWYFRGMSKPTV